MSNGQSAPRSDAVGQQPEDESTKRSEAIGEQLRAKISSKFQTSTFLAGFGFTVLTVQVSTFWQSPKFPHLLPISISMMVMSIFIYIVAVVMFDWLTMPKRFWKEDKDKKDARGSKLAYLEDEDLWGLRHRMVFYWWYLTFAAAILMAASLLLMLLPWFAPRNLSGAIIRETFRFTVLGLIFALIYLAILWGRVRWLICHDRWKKLIRGTD